MSSGFGIVTLVVGFNPQINALFFYVSSEGFYASSRTCNEKSVIKYVFMVFKLHFSIGQSGLLVERVWNIIVKREDYLSFN